MAKDEKTFIGQEPGDYIGYQLAAFNDETGEFCNNKEKVWRASHMNKRYEEGREPSFLNQERNSKNNTFGQKTKKEKKYCKKLHQSTSNRKLKAMQMNVISKALSEKQVLTRSF
jgi:hypothetical protein